MNRRALLAGLAAAFPAVAEPAAPPAIPGRRDLTARLTLKVMVDGTGPYDFLVDTGANRSVIAGQLALRLGLPPGEPSPVHGIAGVQTVPTAQVRGLAVGGLPLGMNRVLVLDGRDLGADGLLGIDAFFDRAVTLDLARNQVRVAPSNHHGLSGFPEGGHAPDEAVVPARQRFGQLTIFDAAVAAVPMVCFIDTGAEVTVGNLAMRRAVRAHAVGRDIAPATTLIHGATGQVVPGEVALVSNMRIGGARFTPFPMAFADLHTFSIWGLQNRPAVMLGMDLLRIFSQVGIDFGRREVRFRGGAR